MLFLATGRHGRTTGLSFSFTKADRRVTCYYFYALLGRRLRADVCQKVCAYFPYPVKI